MNLNSRECVFFSPLLTLFYLLLLHGLTAQRGPRFFFSLSCFILSESHFFLSSISSHPFLPLLIRINPDSDSDIDIDNSYEYHFSSYLLILFSVTFSSCAYLTYLMPLPTPTPLTITSTHHHYHNRYHYVYVYVWCHRSTPSINETCRNFHRIPEFLNS